MEDRPNSVPLFLLVALGIIAALVTYWGSEIVGVINMKQSLQPQAHTVVYVKDVQNSPGSEGVLFYFEAPPPTLPHTIKASHLVNFTSVDMVCWIDMRGERWFYVRVSSSAAYGGGMIGAVRAVDTHNQTRVDRC